MAACPGLAADSIDAHPHLERGYRLLDGEHREAAAAAFEAALAEDPCDAQAHAQLGYIYSDLGRLDAAVEHLRAARRLGFPDPRADLQVAYLYARLDDSPAARRWFARAAEAADTAVAGQAWRELVVRGAAPGTWITELYAAPMYQSRYETAVVPVLVRSGPVLTAPRALQAYLTLRAGRDARLTSGSRAEVIDEAIFAGAGLRVRPLGGSMAGYVEAGPSFDSREPPADGTRIDAAVQAGFYDFRSLGRLRGQSPERLADPFAELYWDASWYSRYSNAIGYLQLRGGLRRTGPVGTLDAYVPVFAVADSRRLFYNNLLETGVGGRWYGERSGVGSIALRVEYLFGRHLVSSPRHDGYRELRLTLVVAGYFAHEAWR